jgi:Na+-driven multidrug efflux pump
MGSLGVWVAISLSNVVGGLIGGFWIKYGNWAEAVIKKNPA